MLSFFVFITYALLDEYEFYVGQVDKSSLYETLFHCNIQSKHHHHQFKVETFCKQYGEVRYDSYYSRWNKIDALNSHDDDEVDLDDNITYMYIATVRPS
jgi:hypothetical protein